MAHQRSCIDLVAHLVWATKKRAPLLLAAMDDDLANFFRGKAATLGCTLLAVGNADDHVHVLARYPSVRCVADLLQSLKARRLTNTTATRTPTDSRSTGRTDPWAESCGPQAVPGLIRYIRRQRAHHARDNRPEPWELALFPKR